MLECPILVHVLYENEAVFFSRGIIVFSESGGDVHDSSSIFNCNKISGDDDEFFPTEFRFGIRVCVKHRDICFSDQFFSRERFFYFWFFGEICGNAVFRQNEFMVIILHHGILDVRVHRKGHVPWQRPWGRGPGHEESVFVFG